MIRLLTWPLRKGIYLATWPAMFTLDLIDPTDD